MAEDRPELPPRDQNLIKPQLSPLPSRWQRLGISKPVMFMREFGRFWFADFWPSLKSAWRTTSEIAGALGIFIPLFIYLLHLARQTEATALNLIWQIPLCAFAIFFALILLHGPFRREQRLKQELRDLKEQQADELAAARASAGHLGMLIEKDRVEIVRLNREK